ncbi:MAG: TniB family NTP-binding protein [Pararheinheimera sp.]|nr:TniB family NTP-binding protein [Rheinheimera sp.]
MDTGKAQSMKLALEFNKKLVRTAEFVEALSDFESLLLMHDPDDPRAMMISGNAGVGKTALLKTMVKQFACIVDSDTISSQKVVMMKATTQNKSLDDFVTEVLKSLGDPTPTYGSYGKKKSRIEALLKERGVIVVIIDEFHDLIPKSKMDQNSRIVQLVKWLFLNAVNPVSVVLAGTTELEELLSIDDQIKTRCLNQIRLEPFSMINLDECQRYLSFAKSLLSYMPSKVISAENGFFYKRLLLASDGNCRVLKNILVKAIEFTTPYEPITIDTMHRAWQKGVNEKQREFTGIAPFLAPEKAVNARLVKLELLSA